MEESDVRRVYGETIFERGLDYFEEERVTGVIKFNNKIIGDVEGSATYKTEVDLNDLNSRCSCQYGSNCKHGVAVLLQYLEGEYSDGDKIIKKLDGMSREDLRCAVDMLIRANPSNLLYLAVQTGGVKKRSGEVLIEALDKHIESRLKRFGYSNADASSADDFASFIRANENVLTKEQIFHILDFLVDSCEDYGWFYDDYSDDYFGDVIFENLCDAFVKKQLEKSDLEKLKELEERDSYDMLDPFFNRLSEVENSINLKDFEEYVRQFLDDSSYIEFLINCGLREKAKIMIESMESLGEDSRFRLYQKIDEGAALDFACRIGAFSSLIKYYHGLGSHSEVVRLFAEVEKDDSRKWMLKKDLYLYNNIFESINKSEQNEALDEVLRLLFEKCFSFQYYGLCAEIGLKLGDKNLMHDLLDKESGYQFDIDEKIKVFNYLKEDYKDEVAIKVMKLVNPLVNKMDNHSYMKAAVCVFLLRDIMDEDKWEEYVKGLYAGHSRKINLWKEFNSKGIFLKKKNTQVTLYDKNNNSTRKR